MIDVIVSTQKYSNKKYKCKVPEKNVTLNVIPISNRIRFPIFQTNNGLKSFLYNIYVYIVIIIPTFLVVTPKNLV